MAMPTGNEIARIVSRECRFWNKPRTIAIIFGVLMIIAAVLVATLGKTEIKTTQADGSTSTRTDSNMWIIGMIIGASGLILIIAVSATRSCEKKQSIYREAVAGMQGSEWKPIKANLANKNWEGFKENAGKLEGSDLNQLASAVAAIKRSRNAKKAWQ